MRKTPNASRCRSLGFGFGFLFFFSSRRRHTRLQGDWSSDVCSSDLFDVPLSFLAPGRRYVAEIYADGPGAHWLTNPLPVSISQRAVDARTSLHLVLAPGSEDQMEARPRRRREDEPPSGPRSRGRASDPDSAGAIRSE